MFLPGCAGLDKTPWHSKVPLFEHYQAKALEFEKRGEMQMSLLNWKIAGNLRPGDRKIEEKIADLKASIENEAEKHFKKGVASYKNDSFEGAKKEFLTALRYNPDHSEALDYLKHKLTGEGYIVYKVKEGDTLRAIAQEVYKDPGKDFLISHFTDIETKEHPAPGITLKLPILEPELTGELVNIEEELIKARNCLKAEDYEKVLTIAGKILEYDPENKDAADLANASYYQIGKSLCLKERYMEALKMFNKVPPDHEGVKESISDVIKRLIKQAEIHYRMGVKHFVNEELEKAIKEWERTLVLNPEHQKAKKDIEDARSLLEKLNQIKSGDPPSG
jgi:tetratricopeptide (TPR) repeat protein